MKATVNYITNDVAAKNANLHRKVQTVEDGANINRTDQYLLLLNMTYSCIQLSARCASADEGAEKAKLTATLNADYTHVEKMKEHFSKKEYNKIAPRTKSEDDGPSFL